MSTGMGMVTATGTGTGVTVTRSISHLGSSHLVFLSDWLARSVDVLKQTIKAKDEELQRVKKALELERKIRRKGKSSVSSKGSPIRKCTHSYIKLSTAC